MVKRWFTVGSLIVLAATVTACGTSADSTVTSTSFSDDARPEDPGAAEVIRELGLDALPGLAPSAVARVQRERRDQRWYRPAATQPVAGHSHDDAASQAAIDGMDATTRAMLDQQLARARRAAGRTARQDLVMPISVRS